jgi:hypothetical protein
MMRRAALFVTLLLALSATAADRTEVLLAKAWPAASFASLEDLGAGVGVVFTPDLSVPGNCDFYNALGFACFESPDWLEILSRPGKRQPMRGPTSPSARCRRRSSRTACATSSSAPAIQDGSCVPRSIAS